MVKLTQEQLNFYNDVCYKESISSYGLILLNAPAGTGKSTVIKDLYNDFKDDVILLAPTHKAVTVLKQGNSFMKVQTIHRFLLAEANINPINGIRFFIFKLDTSKIKGKLIIVDECSMIDDKMFEEFELLSKNNLVIFCGDDLQLPPIDIPENIDEMTEDEIKKNKKPSKLSKTFSVLDKYTFTKNMRSRNSVHTYMLENARKACYLKKMPIKITGKKLDEILDIFEQNKESNNTESVILLSYSNKSVNSYNKKIRSRLFKVDEDELDMYYTDEKLVFSGYRCTKKGIKYYSSDIINIKDLSIVSQTIDYLKCPKCKDNEYNLTKCKLHKFNKGDLTLEFYKITDQYDTIWYKPIDRTKFNILKKQYKDICIMFKSGYLWKSYYGLIEEYDADLKYSYSMTIHKSQGSQFNIVFVDRSNLTKCNSKDILLKVNGYYTAISRMIDEVYDVVNY